MGTIFGFTLMLWISIQFVIFPYNVLSTSYFIFGILQLIAGYITYVFYLQSKFKFNINDYDNIGTNKKVCVVYFSRMGYTKKVAYEIANKEGADIIELKTTEKTTNTTEDVLPPKASVLFSLRFDKRKKMYACSIPYTRYCVCRFMSIEIWKFDRIRQILSLHFPLRRVML